MVGLMRTGSVVVDLAAEMGGNCELTKRNEVVDARRSEDCWVRQSYLASLPKDASTLFAKNLLNFLSPHVNSETKSLELRLGR
jgi:NAD(P) transhydrogenase subunit alpha